MLNFKFHQYVSLIGDSEALANRLSQVLGAKELNGKDILMMLEQ